MYVEVFQIDSKQQNKQHTNLNNIKICQNFNKLFVIFMILVCLFVCFVGDIRVIKTKYFFIYKLKKNVSQSQTNNEWSILISAFETVGMFVQAQACWKVHATLQKTASSSFYVLLLTTFISCMQQVIRMSMSCSVNLIQILHQTPYTISDLIRHKNNSLQSHWT